MEEIYISTQVETDGSIPGPHSILSFGSAADTADEQPTSAFNPDSAVQLIFGTPAVQSSAWGDSGKFR